jgi:hypothetical protein
MIGPQKAVARAMSFVPMVVYKSMILPVWGAPDLDAFEMG